MDDGIADHLAQLLVQHLRRDPRHQAAQLQELSRRPGEPVNDDQLPLSADRRKRRSQRTVCDGVPSPRLAGGYLEVTSGGHDVSAVTMPGMSLLLLFSGVIALLTASQPIAEKDGPRDFDFEVGSWTAHRSRLDHPLTGSSQWVDYNGTSVVRRVWDGRANIGELDVSGPA